MGAEDIAVKARAQERETPRVYSVGEAARKFEVSPDTIRRYEDEGIISPQRILNRRALTDEDISKIESHRRSIRARSAATA